MTDLGNPLVTVIIPFLNGGRWLGEAIDSVISQTYTRWEMVLIDDGSDETHSLVAQRYADCYPGKISYIDHPGHVNRGVTVSRNAGIRLAKGSYIAFLDADDCWLPQKLQHQLEIFELQSEAGMICEASKFWYSWDKPHLEDLIIQIGSQPDKLYFLLN
ncbi:MAG: glycosyltransferase family A protein [Ferruginibacter sp.]